MQVRNTTEVAVNTFREWSTPLGLISCGWALAACSAAWWWLAETPTDRLFVGVLTVVLAVASGCGSVLRPRLRADPSGIALRGFTGTRHHPWSQVRFQVRSRQRLGLTSSTLELDTESGELVVLGKLDLGEDPQDVADALEDLRA
ncbi:PH domain-containing protein [Saccharopolyspora sp. NFXS83]|uniref:PH domain-containing protein n=1 Tax=Saccharopolyspora sp. NFXS83 TaxID=2993560 RepID=UPI00224B40A4|nr:PH domain-containing protein [Saccharopolyspora sp. NFXS83]MCX2731266.1 PH domain-containing protein [Saccharopolyspora sp. NFXS83]